MGIRVCFLAIRIPRPPQTGSRQEYQNFLVLRNRGYRMHFTHHSIIRLKVEQITLFLNLDFPARRPIIQPFARTMRSFVCLAALGSRRFWFLRREPSFAGHPNGHSDPQIAASHYHRLIPCPLEVDIAGVTARYSCDLSARAAAQVQAAPVTRSTALDASPAHLPLPSARSQDNSQSQQRTPISQLAAPV